MKRWSWSCSVRLDLGDIWIGAAWTRYAGDFDIYIGVLPMVQVHITKRRHCTVCGCTWENACLGGCEWVGPHLCSSCHGLGSEPVT